MAATLDTISAALNLFDAKKQNLKKAFDVLQSHSSLLSPFLSLSWPEIDSHFTSLHHSLTHRFHLLQSQNPNRNPNPNPNTSTPPPEDTKDANFPSLPTDPSTSSCAFPQNYVVSGSVTPRYHLGVLCEKMDGVGLRNYLTAHFKDRVKLQFELPGSLRCAPDPAQMILEALEGFHCVENGHGVPKDLDLRKMKKCCIMLLKQLRVLNPCVGSKVREKALKVAVEWRGRLVVDFANGNTLGALGFLHLVAAFGLVYEFSADELVDFAVMAAINEEVPELCRITGLEDRVPDIIQKLIDRGKHVLAVKYIFEFNLADNIPPVPILKACVDESKKLAERLSQEGKSLTETTAREIHALKIVIKIIDNHKLEFEYPRSSLEQRIEQLMRQKANMKRPAPASTSKPPQHQQQQQPQKRKMQKQKQQQSGIKRPRPAVALSNINNGNSTIHHQQPHVHPSGLFPEHPNPYMSSTAMPFGMVAPTQTISPYTGPLAGPYGLAGVPVGPSGHPSVGGSHPNSYEPHVPFGYYDRASAYDGVGLQHYYQASYYPQ